MLYGALCGGPTSTDFSTFRKLDAKDATSNEVALDYQVGLVGAAAGLYNAYGTGNVVAEIGDEVTVYAEEIAAAKGEIPQPPETTTTEETTTTTEATTTTTEATTTTTEATTTAETPEETTTTAQQPDEVLYGDANCDGKVEIADATLILQFLTNKDEYSLSEQGMKNADVANNGDGVTASDALVIQKVDAGIYKLSDLPVKE